MGSVGSCFPPQMRWMAPTDKGEDDIILELFLQRAFSVPRIIKLLSFVDSCCQDYKRAFHNPGLDKEVITQLWYK